MKAKALEANATHAYDDIMHLSCPTSPSHPRMPMMNRAAQFSPFAALTGHEEAIRETERLTDEKVLLTEDEMNRINACIYQVREQIGRGEPAAVSVTYFVPDVQKEGGEYVTRTGSVQKIQEYEHRMNLTDGTSIALEEIVEIEIIRTMDV